MTKKQTLINDLSDETSTFLSTSSIHGLGHLNNATKILEKLFWLSVFIVCLSMAIFFISSSFTDWGTNAVAATVDVVQATKEAQFPAVTICPTGFVDGGALEKLLNWIKVTRDIRDKVRVPVGEFLRNNYNLDHQAEAKFVCNRCYMNTLTDFRIRTTQKYHRDCGATPGSKKAFCKWANMAFLNTWQLDRSGNRSTWLAAYPSIVGRYKSMDEFEAAVNSTLDEYWVDKNKYHGNFNNSYEVFGLEDIPYAKENALPEIEEDFTASDWKQLLRIFLKLRYGLYPTPFNNLGTLAQFLMNREWYYYDHAINDLRPQLDLEPFSDILRDLLGALFEDGKSSWSDMTIEGFEEVMAMFMQLEMRPEEAMSESQKKLVDLLSREENFSILMSLMRHTLMPAHIYDENPPAQNLSRSALSSLYELKEPDDIDEGKEAVEGFEEMMGALPQNMFLNRNAFIPACLWTGDALGEARGLRDMPMCNAFVPSITDRGICYTFYTNPEVRPRLQKSHFKDSFEKIFDTHIEKDNVTLKKLQHRGVGAKNAMTFIFNSNELKRKIFRPDEKVPMKVPGHSVLLGNMEEYGYFNFPMAIHEQVTSALIRPSPDSIDLKVYNSYGDQKVDFWNDKAFMLFHISVTPVVTHTDEVLSSLNVDQRQCYFPNEGNLKLFKDYTNEHCIIECKIKNATAKCGCTPWNYPRAEGTKVCGPREAGCFDDEMKQASNDPKIVDDCKCYPSCSSTQYKFRLDKVERFEVGHTNPYFKLHNQTKYNFDYSVGLLADYVMDADYKLYDSFPYKYLFGPNSFTGRSATSVGFFDPFTKRKLADMSAVNIYFESATCLKIHKSLRMTFADKLGSIGGNLGLFLGVSIFSVVELFSYLGKAGHAVLSVGKRIKRSDARP